MMAANNPNNKKNTPERIENIRSKYKTHTVAYEKDNTNDAEIVDTRKEKLAATEARLTRHRKSQRRKNYNKRFKINEKKFYAEIGKTKTTPV
jgi:Skp family chaperone for outer membrane proteins